MGKELTSKILDTKWVLYIMLLLKNELFAIESSFLQKKESFKQKKCIAVKIVA